MSSISDLPASTVIGRAFDTRDEVSLVNRVLKGMVDNVREIIDRGDWWNEISELGEPSKKNVPNCGKSP